MGRSVGASVRFTSDASDWRRFAKCKGQPHELFEEPLPLDDRGRPRAAGVCAGCPVGRACLDGALVEGDDTTYRGGTTPEMRRAIRAAERHNRELEGAVPCS